MYSSMSARGVADMTWALTSGMVWEESGIPAMPQRPLMRAQAVTPPILWRFGMRISAAWHFTAS